MYPLVGMAGKARTGKDTAGAMFAKRMSGTCIAFADPLKRLAMALCGFTADQCWGDGKDVPDPRFDLDGKRPEETEGYKFVQGALASGVVTEIVADLFGILENKALDNLFEWKLGLLYHRIQSIGNVTPRWALQTLGTEWGRATQRDVWVDYAVKVAKKLLRGGFIYDKVTGLDEADSPYEGPRGVVITDARFPNELAAVKEVGGTCIEVVRTGADVVGAHQSETARDLISEWWYDFRISNNGTLDQLAGKVDFAFEQLFDSGYNIYVSRKL